jgi:hypothetical protein
MPVLCRVRQQTAGTIVMFRVVDVNSPGAGLSRYPR